MKKLLVLVPVLFLAACATTTPNSEQYSRVYDSKTNTVRYVNKATDASNAFVGTAATQGGRLANGRYVWEHP